MLKKKIKQLLIKTKPNESLGLKENQKNTIYINEAGLYQLINRLAIPKSHFKSGIWRPFVKSEEHKNNNLQVKWR